MLPSAEFIKSVDSRLDEFAQHLLGRDGSTRGRPPWKYFVPRIVGAAEALTLSGDPKLIFPVWVDILPSPETGAIASVKKPKDGLVAYWEGSDTTLLAYDERRSTEVIGLPHGAFQARPVEFHKKRTVVPGMVATNGALHLAIGLRNAISVPSSLTDRSRPYFAEITQLLSGTPAP